VAQFHLSTATQKSAFLVFAEILQVICIILYQKNERTVELTDKKEEAVTKAS